MILLMEKVLLEITCNEFVKGVNIHNILADKLNRDSKTFSVFLDRIKSKAPMVADYLDEHTNDCEILIPYIEVSSFLKFVPRKSDRTTLVIEVPYTFELTKYAKDNELLEYLPREWQN